jgi:hypothetical protein
MASKTLKREEYCIFE